MCTVTLIPQPSGHFILTSNRDESPLRSPENLDLEHFSQRDLLFPKDKGAGGSWIAASSDNKVACVLNGAFEKHQHLPPYRKSRGVMLVEFFSFPSVKEFASKYDFEGIEPFTIILVANNEPNELRWDGQSIHLLELNKETKFIWSSATLYPPAVQAVRRKWFDDWQNCTNDFGLKAIRDFHLHGGEKDLWNGFVMNRNEKVRTVSVTSIVQTSEGFEMIYADLLRNAEKQKSVGFREVPSHANFSRQ